MQTAIALNPENVHRVFTDCLFKDDEVVTDFVLAEGISMKVGFHPERLAEHAYVIDRFLDQLTGELSEGVSFLNLIYNHQGQQWTSEHIIMEQLVLLGLGIGKLDCQLPEEFWPELPGGMPYYART